MSCRAECRSVRCFLSKLFFNIHTYIHTYIHTWLKVTSAQGRAPSNRPSADPQRATNISPGYLKGFTSSWPKAPALVFTRDRDQARLEIPFLRTLTSSPQLPGDRDPDWGNCIAFKFGQNTEHQVINTHLLDFNKALEVIRTRRNDIIQDSILVQNLHCLQQKVPVRTGSGKTKSSQEHVVAGVVHGGQQSTTLANKAPTTNQQWLEAPPGLQKIKPLKRSKVQQEATELLSNAWSSHPTQSARLLLS